jgi:hypothetical protein
MEKNYYWPVGVCALAVCLVMCFAVAAWKSPGETPPGGNVAAPINTGVDAQYKTGGLGLKIGGAVTYWISQVGNNLVFKTGNDFGTAAETVNIDADGRIGNVSPAIDDNDAVIKAQLDAADGGGSGYGTCDGDQLFVKFTATEYEGNLGGVAGADAKCAAEYPGYHFCQKTEFMDAGRTGCLPSPTQYKSGGAWINYDDSVSCSGWTAEFSYGYVLATGEYSQWMVETDACSHYDEGNSIACCRKI